MTMVCIGAENVLTLGKNVLFFNKSDFFKENLYLPCKWPALFGRYVMMEIPGNPENGGKGQEDDANYDKPGL